MREVLRHTRLQAYRSLYSYSFTYTLKIVRLSVGHTLCAVVLVCCLVLLKAVPSADLCEHVLGPTACSLSDA